MACSIHVLRKDLRGHTARVQSDCQVDDERDDGKWIATGSEDNQIRLWDTETGAKVRMMEGGHHQGVTCLCAMPAQGLVASGSHDNSVRLWDPRDGTLKRVLSGHENTVYALMMMPNRTSLSSCSADASIRIWNLIDGTDTVLTAFDDRHPDDIRRGGRNLPGHKLATTAMCLMKANTWLCSCSDDKATFLWELPEALLAPPPEEEEAPEGESKFYQCKAIRPD